MAGKENPSASVKDTPKAPIKPKGEGVNQEKFPPAGKEDVKNVNNIEVKEENKIKNTDIQNKENLLKQEKNKLDDKRTASKEVAEGQKTYQDGIDAFQEWDSPGMIPPRPDQKMVKKEDFERSQTELKEQENKTAEAIKGKMDIQLESVTKNGNIDLLDPQVQSRIRTEAVRVSVDPQSLPDDKKRQILGTMTGPNGKPLDMTKVDLNALTPTQKDFILNSQTIREMSSNAVEEFKKLQESGGDSKPELLDALKAKYYLPSISSLKLSQLEGSQLSEYPSDSQIGIVQRVLAESTFGDLQDTLGKGLKWSHVPESVKRELLLESFSYDPAKNSAEVEQALREAKLTANNLKTERRQGESEEQFSARVKEKTGLTRPDLNTLSREARKSGLSPMMRILADFFGPIGAALGLPFWQEYMQGSQDAGRHASGRWQKDSHLDDPNKPSGVLRSNKRYLDGTEQSGFKLEGGSYEEQAKSAAEAIKSNQSRYEAVSAKTGVPWELIGAIHFRESSLNFNTCLHNGDPLGQKTVRVPAGRGPFATWEDAAIDALNMKGELGFTSITESKQLEQAASYAERYNGLGYRNRGVASAYVWAGTEAYTGGMYVADHEFSRTKKDPRPGVMPIIYSLLGKDEGGNDRLEKFKNDRSKIIEPSFEEYYTAQNNSNNCGPTACAIVAAKLLGGDPEQLEREFTREKPGAMSWDTPGQLLGRFGLSVEQAPSLSSSDIHTYLQDPNCAIITSVTPKSGLTGGGHITALVGSEQIGDSYTFQNADPNANNIEKGYGSLPGKRLENGGAKQFWIVRKGSPVG